MNSDGVMEMAEWFSCHMGYASEDMGWVQERYRMSDEETAAVRAWLELYEEDGI